jgi:hypothetical protein
MAGAKSAGFVNISMVGDAKNLSMKLTKLETTLASASMAAWLGTVVEPYLSGRAKHRFASEGDDVTGAWAPLKEATWAFRSPQYGPAHPINKRTGALEQYIVGTPGHPYPHSLGATLIYPGTPPKGETKKKVIVAQAGQQTRPVTVPRPVLGVNERDLLTVLTDLSLFISVRQLT